MRLHNQHGFCPQGRHHTDFVFQHLGGDADYCGQMEDRKHMDLVRLSESEREQLFKRLGDSDRGDAASGDDRRTEPRWNHRRHDIRVSIEQPGGGSSRFLILARNLSTNGMGFIHGGFIHETSRCMVELQSTDGVIQTVPGSVVMCRHLEGSLHEVGIRFDHPIEPTRFLTFDHLDETIAGDASLPALKGRALYLDKCDISANLLAYYLSPTDIALTRVSTIAQARAALAANTFDLIAVELDLGLESGVVAIEQIRKDGYDGAFVVITAETREQTHSEAMWAGADHIISKPYRPQVLHELLKRLQSEGRAFTSHGVIYSTVNAQDGLSGMLVQFIEHAERTAQQIERSVTQQCVEEARAACLTLKGTAAGYGFGALGEVAADTLTLLDEAWSMDQCTEQLQALTGMCRRLAAHPETR